MPALLLTFFSFCSPYEHLEQVKTPSGVEWLRRDQLSQATAGSQPPAPRPSTDGQVASGHPVVVDESTVVGSQPHDDDAEQEEREEEERAEKAQEASAFVEVKDSGVEGAGLGAFATQALAAGQVILMEKALFRANDDTLATVLTKLDDKKRAAFQKLHAYHPHQDVDVELSRFRTNNFHISTFLQGVFIEAARFNHACNPFNNVSYIYDSVRDCIVMSANRDIAKGEELFICYSYSPNMILPLWGFKCQCPSCKEHPRRVREPSEPDWS
jgi:hypothetical protein